MSETAASSPDSHFGVVLRFLVVVGFAVAAIWLVVSQHRLSNEVAKANSDRANLVREVETLRSEMEKQAAAVNQTVNDSLRKVSDRLDQRPAGLDRALMEHVAVQIKSLADNIAAMSSHIDQQTAVMNRALGRVIPVVLPPEWENQLSQLEGKIKDPGHWPKDATEAQGFLDQASSLIKSMPAWAEADYLARLTPVRWAAMAFVSINRPRDDAAITLIVEEANGLVNAAPEGGSPDLLQRLQKEAKVLSEKLEQSKLAEAIKAGENYVENANSFSDDRLADVSNVYDILGLHVKDGPKASEVRGLRTQLQKLMVVRQGKQQAASLTQRWSVVSALKDDQPGIFDMSVSVLLQEVAATRVALALEGVKEPALDELENALRRVISETSTQAARREEERQAKAMREYQRWALGEVVAFDRKFAATEAQANRDGSMWKRDNGGWSEDRYKEVREAMVTHLLPVNLSLTDPPIQDRYEKAFQKGWKKLDGREDQTIVAERTALIVKKPVQDFLEGQR